VPAARDHHLSLDGDHKPYNAPHDSAAAPAHPDETKAAYYTDRAADHHHDSLHRDHTAYNHADRSNYHHNSN
jgi:hypothetical protein